MIFRSEIRREDLEQVRALVGKTGFFYPTEIEVAVELFEETLSSEASGYLFVIAENEGKIAGYSCYGEIPLTTGSYDLYWLVVDKEQQRKGLGRELVRRTEEDLQSRGGRALYAETSGRELYSSTRTFYAKTDFQEIARYSDFYSIGDDKVVFRKCLSPVRK